MRTIIFSLTLLLFTGNALAGHNVKQTILELEQTRINSILKKDIASIEQIMADDCIHITTDGSLRTKQQYMTRLRSSSGAKAHFASFNLRDVKVRIFDDIAITTGHYDNAKKIEGKLQATKYGVFTRVYQLRQDRWLLISHQATVDSKYNNKF